MKKHEIIVCFQIFTTNEKQGIPPPKTLEIQVGGGGSYNLDIQMGGGSEKFWESRWEGGGGQKMLPSMGRGVWIFSGITHLTKQIRQIDWLIYFHLF